MEKLEPSYADDGNVKWYRHGRKQPGSSAGQFLKKLYMQSPHDPEILPLGKYPTELKTDCSHKNLYKNVQISITDNGQVVETTQMSIS